MSHAELLQNYLIIHFFFPSSFSKPEVFVLMSFVPFFQMKFIARMN